MKKIGFILDNLGPNQLAYYAITNANKYANDVDKDIVLFYQTLSKTCVRPKVSCMHVNEAWSFNGALIATDLISTQQLVNMYVTPQKFFYVWDFEWMRLPNKDFSVFNSLYNNDKLELFTRSQEHKLAVEDCWNTKVLDVVDDCDFGKMLEYVDSRNC